jgi:valyl-tRNA synthetase
MWTFSTLGWPEKTMDLKTFHPTDLMETGRDIIFFWVARMILMSAYALGEIPFKNVYLHGLVRDEQGRKMSKSLDNIIDPVDVADKYGTDAVRLSLVIGTTPGMDTRVGDAKIAGFRNFTNKLWNIGRYVQTKAENRKPKSSVADKWILSRLATVTAEVTKQLEQHSFSAAGELLREFTWNDFADWYVEIHKREGNDVVLRQVFETLLSMWHPYMPFVTEVLWQQSGHDDLLMVAEWPKGGKRDPKAEKEFGKFREVVDAIRAMHASQGTSPGNVIAAVMEAGSLELALKNLRPVVDAKKESDRLKKELAEVEKFIALIEGRIGNKDFTARAPAQVVAAEREKLAEAMGRREKIKSQLG